MLNGRLIKLLLPLLAILPATVNIAQAAEDDGRSVVVTAEPATGRTVSLEIEQAYRLAMKQNSDILASSEKTNGARELARLARAPFLPQARLEAGYTYIDPEPIIEMAFNVPIPEALGGPMSFNRDIQLGYHNNYKLSLLAGWNVFSWWADYDQYQAAQLGLDLAELNEEKAKQEIALQVAGSFYGILLLQEQLQLLEKMMATKQSHLDSVSLNFRGGVASELEKLQTEVGVESLRPEVGSVRNNLALADLALKRLLGIEPETEVTLIGEIEAVSLRDDLKNAIDEADERNSALKMLQLQEQILSKQASSADARNMPSITVGGKLDYANPYNMEDEWGSSWALFAQASWPIFDGFVSSARAGLIEAGRAELSHRIRAARRAIAIGVRAAFLSAKNAETTLVAIERNELLAEKAHQIATTGYNNGTATNDNVLDAEVGLLAVKLQLLKARYDQIMARLQLLQATGEILDQFEGR
jgi:outer membrane protein TolC